MRIMVFLLFWPAMALAQLAPVPPNSVIGFLRLEQPEARVVLTLDNEGTVGLYIFSESAETPAAYYPDFSATNGEAPALLPVGSGAFSVEQWTRHGEGTTWFSERISWLDGADAGFYTTGAAYRFNPRSEATPQVNCTVDFVTGELSVAVNDGAVRMVAVRLMPKRLGAGLPEGWDDGCEP